MDDYDREQDRLNAIIAPLDGEPEDHAIWDKAIVEVMDFDGGLTRNSSDLAISTIRNIYDRLLARFPLYYGYWKKYADLEFNLVGSEGADMVYERGIASIPVCSMLWSMYCDHKSQTCHDPDLNRELFERGAECCGLDWNSDPFWDKWLEFEDRMEAPAQKYKVLLRLLQLPIAHYQKYYEMLRTMSHGRPVNELLPEATLKTFYKQVEEGAAAYGRPRSEAEKERDLRQLVDNQYNVTVRVTYDEYSKRWAYEQGLNPNYFTTHDLSSQQQTLWRTYLDFEESAGGFERTRILYERCVTVCTNYEEFWLRYARWMSVQEGKEDNTRHIYQRASCVFLPMALPTIRFQWSRYEEQFPSRREVARAILEAMLMATPGNLEAVEALANFARRHQDLDAALDVYKAQIANTNSNLKLRGAIISKAANMVFKFRGAEEARQLFEDNIASYDKVPAFWRGYLRLEMEQAARFPRDLEQRARIQALHAKIRKQEDGVHIHQHEIDSISDVYMKFLMEYGGEDAAKEIMALDIKMYSSTKAPTSK